MKKTLAMILALVMMLSLVACGGSDKPAVKNPNSLSVCLASEPDSLDPALNSALDGGTLCLHLFSGLAKWNQMEDGKMDIVADAATELPKAVINADGTATYTYTLRDMTWSDGKPVTAGDYEFAWKRAASSELGADYGYMFDVIKGYPDNLAVKATDDKTLQVTLNNDLPYWNELLAFPVFLPVREDVVANEGWATSPETYVSNGAYTMTAWEHDSVITLTKNENHPDADKVTMPEVKFYLSDDANNMLTNFKKGDWLLIDDVPTNEMKSLKSNYPNEYVVADLIGTYYVSWNINKSLLPATSTLTGADAVAANAEIRNALSLLLDRNYITENIGQADQIPAPSFVSAGVTNPDGSQFYQSAGSDEFDGYYDVSPDAIESNYTQAIETLKKYYTFDEATGKFTDMPTITYLYNTSEGHKAIAEYVQTAFAAIGCNVNLENQEWNTFLNTRKQGNYDVARNGWVSDYRDPICYLDMWTTASGNNDVQFGKGDHAKMAMYDLDLTPFGYKTKVEDGTWAETYDVLIKTIKSCSDPETRYAMMHMAEDMLMETGCITPIYFQSDVYMINEAVKGFYSNPLGFKFFMNTTIEA